MKEELSEKKIAVLAGGLSSEREISLKSGMAVFNTLKAGGYDVWLIDADLEVALKLTSLEPDVVLTALHGGWGENGSIQGMLEVMGMAYTGSGVLASALAMDKVMCKYLFERAGLSVPPFEIVEFKGAQLSIAAMCGQKRLAVDFPWIIKPAQEGSSVGVSIVKGEADYVRALREAFIYGNQAIVEKFIKGKEIQIGIVNGRVLGGVEIRPSGEFYDYKSKYTSGMTDYILPPEVSLKTYDKIVEMSVKAYDCLGCKGAARVDTILSDDNEVYVLEVNTVPGMTETSLLPKIAEAAGVSFLELLEDMLTDAILRKNTQVMTAAI
ncbi:D-alanine--D-alanine ligase [Candidatus Magnetominusculus xianensis]|uniref:D-alanine--D-alanine ligase n=1 Tax=Candidatus Magnetominusculus xianensis TaxID=1748249 RepID=A0ABR5SHU4_9BACT|nr:D-alanine--D-alanine ligase [Candidatus Magnetominusculus xianensis]KWT89811.1 D-alanine--D-alanine ligase [Candidatus Magnetominusculus xianensis]MBF0404598.1 D-alanine--D-alanine ligase [Nitrospirota bacterium]